jgi:hypothetical protein
MTRAPYRAGGFRANAVPVVIDGIRFASKAEGRSYMDFRMMQQLGEIQWFIRQPSFDLPGQIKYRADFLVVEKDGRVRVFDTKGFRTKEFDLKMRLMKEAYPKVEVELIGGSHGRVPALLHEM